MRQAHDREYKAIAGVESHLPRDEWCESFDEVPADVAMVVPVMERPESLADLYREYVPIVEELGLGYEFHVVADTRYPHLLDDLEDLKDEDAGIRLHRAGQLLGEAAMVERALQNTRADVILILPAYFRVEAAALPDLLEAVEQGADVAMARRTPRRDGWMNRFQTRVFHFLLNRVGGHTVDDIACGVRAVRRHVLESVPLYGDFFRFFPLFASRDGYRVVQVDARQHPGDLRTRVYSPGIYVRRLIDLLAVFFLLRFTWKPLRFFGLVGSTLAALGGGVLALLFVQRLGGEGIADRPLLLLGVLLVVLGVQAVAMGLVGEIIVHLNAPNRKRYRVARFAGGEHDD